MVRGTDCRRGIVLIVVLGVLVVLALLATTFATLQRIDRTVSKNYMDDVRAKLLAQSGVEYALSQIREMMSQGTFGSRAGGPVPWIYWGDDVGETGQNPSLLSVPVERCKNPSWAFEDETTQNPTDPNITPKLINIRLPDGTIAQRGFTAYHDSGTYTKYGDTYTLRVVDSSGMIYVNDGLYQYGGNASTVSVNLRRILNNLGKSGSIQITNLGDLILNNRPPAGYTSKYELRKAVGYNETLFNKFKNFVTTHAWVDKNVVNPVPLSTQMLGAYPVTYYRGNLNPIYRRGRGTNQWWQDRFAAEPLMWYQPGNSSLNHNAIYAHDELFPSYVEAVWRAPVNVNTAPEPVLTALIADVCGFFSIERRRFQPFAGSPQGFSYTGPGFSGGPITFTIPQQYLTWMYVQHTFDAQGTGGDEIGNLYRTADFVATGGTGTGLSASSVANAIIQCRSNSGIYANRPFGGPFKSWAQFYEFLDFCVLQGIITDSRAIFGDFSTNPMPTGAMQYVPSGANGAPNKYAAQAAADALKANFNPNCHLNETNPDRNTYLLVDKTDLIINSTEFCFTPMGYYEIESVGRVMRPQEVTSFGTGTGPVDALTSTGNIVVAEKKILVAVKIFDVYRETSQRHFYEGSLYPRQSSPETNNNMSLEVGPEVDNGPLVYNDLWGLSTPMQLNPILDGYAGYAPGVSTQNTGWGYEYDGYVALPTIGGNNTDMAFSKPKGTLWTTPAGGAQFGSMIHSHFAWDFKAHHHQSAIAHSNDWFRDELGSVLRYATAYIDQMPYTKTPKIERALNFNDRLEPILSPYGPTYGTKYRLARSFRLPLQPGGSGSQAAPPPPALPNFAPSDLRIDGAYSERHSGLAYWMDEGVSWDEQNGMMCAWIKPSFFPEHTGKMRKVFGMSRWHAKNFGYRNPNPWDCLYMPAHDTMPYQVSNTETMTPSYQGAPYSTCSDHPVESVGGKGVYPFRPMSLNMFWGIHCFTGSLADMWDEGPWLEEENYACTPSLNHKLHGGGGESSKPNFLDKGKWMHLIGWWNTVVGSYVTTGSHAMRLYVDGLLPAGEAYPFAGSIFDSSFRTRYYTIQSFSDAATGKWLTNTIRLGECSSHGFGTFNRNYSADLTFDEFYVWRTNDGSSIQNALQMWQRGRYYKPFWNNYSDSVFVSKSINLDQVVPPRYLPPPSTTAAPPMTTGVGAGSGGSATTSTPPPPTVPKRRLLGVSWTWHAEAYVKTGTSLVPIMYDHQNPNAPTPLYQSDTGQPMGVPESSVRVFILADGQQFPVSQPNGFTDDGFSKISGTDGKPYQVNNPQDIKYKLWFQIRGLTTSSILLATPVFDDITIFYDQGDLEFLIYALVNTV